MISYITGTFLYENDDICLIIYRRNRRIYLSILTFIITFIIYRETYTYIDNQNLSDEDIELINQTLDEIYDKTSNLYFTPEF